jgi:hypothetical protein
MKALSTSEWLFLFNGHVWERDLDRMLPTLIIEIAQHGHAYDQGTHEHILHVINSSFFLFASQIQKQLRSPIRIKCCGGRAGLGFIVANHFGFHRDQPLDCFDLLFHEQNVRNLDRLFIRATDCER